jgi:PAS domain S-box-containing protein
VEGDRAIIEHAAGDAFFVYDAGGRILDANRRACETLGYTREELLSLSMTDVEAILLPEGVAGLWRRLASGEPVTTEGPSGARTEPPSPSRSGSGSSGRSADVGSRSP